jgi:hypothetical protein
MLVSNKVVCDYCTNEQYGIFSYYAVEYGKISVNTSKKYTTRWKKELEYDMCSKCLDKLKTHVLSIPDRVVTKLTLNCDTCSSVLSGDFHYHYIKFDKVDLDATGGKTTMLAHIKDILSIRSCMSCIDSVRNLFSKNKTNIEENAKKFGKWS